MVTRGRRKKVDRSLSDKYRRVGAAFLESTRALRDLEVDQYGNAIGVIAIHAAIAYVDALTIAFAGFKSTAGDHEKATEALQEAIGSRAEPRRVKQLRSILQRKDEVYYAGTYYRISDSEKLLSDTVEFCEWAEQTYNHRPRGI